MESSGRLQVAGGLLAALDDDFETDFLTLDQRAHTCALYGRDVHKHVFRSIVRLNEAVALLRIEKFDSSDRHQEFPFTLPVERRRVIAPAVTSQVFGSSLERSPKPGAWQQVEAENQVAGGDIDVFRCNVNGSARDWRDRITVYEFVKASCYGRASLLRQLTETECSKTTRPDLVLRDAMRGDKRKARRHRLRRDAWLMLEAGQRCECVITNISDRGTHINVADSDAIPDDFILLLAENGATRRRCRVIWRKPREIGVKFNSWLDDRIQAVARPKPDARTATGEPEPAENLRHS